MVLQSHSTNLALSGILNSGRTMSGSQIDLPPKNRLVIKATWAMIRPKHLMGAFKAATPLPC